MVCLEALPWCGFNVAFWSQVCKVLTEQTKDNFLWTDEAKVEVFSAQCFMWWKSNHSISADTPHVVFCSHRTWVPAVIESTMNSSNKCSSVKSEIICLAAKAQGNSDHANTAAKIQYDGKRRKRQGLAMARPQPDWSVLVGPTPFHNIVRNWKHRIVSKHGSAGCITNFKHFRLFFVK